MLSEFLEKRRQKKLKEAETIQYLFDKRKEQKELANKNQDKKVDVKKAISTVVLSVPVIGFAKYAYDVYKLKQYYAGGEDVAEKINAVIDLMPTSTDEYTAFMNDSNVDSQAKNVFNDALADVKSRGVVSDEFLKEHSFNSKEEFDLKLDELYASGKAGDLDAREAFDNLIQDYNDDFFGQAFDIASTNYYNLSMAEYVPSDLHVGILDVVNSMPLNETLVGAVCCAGTIIATVTLYDKTTFAKKRFLKKLLKKGYTPEDILAGKHKKKKKHDKQSDEKTNSEPSIAPSDEPSDVPSEVPNNTPCDVPSDAPNSLDDEKEKVQ